MEKNKKKLMYEDEINKMTEDLRKVESTRSKKIISDEVEHLKRQHAELVEVKSWKKDLPWAALYVSGTVLGVSLFLHFVN